MEGFLDRPLPEAIEVRKARAAKVLAVDDAVSAAVEALKKRGMVSPYLRAFVVARVNPVRFHKGEPPPFDASIEKMLAAAKRFDAGKVKETDIARTGGPPPAAEE